MIAVADTGPLLYLSLVGRVELLPLLFERVLVPEAVVDELTHVSTPELVRRFVADCPSWLQVCPASETDSSLRRSGRGEREAIALAVSRGADVLLIDDLRAKKFATQTMGIAVSGTIGVFYEAVVNDLVVFDADDFDLAIEDLLATNFHAGTGLRESLKELSHRLHERQNQQRS